jgi:hypothetical protein
MKHLRRYGNMTINWVSHKGYASSHKGYASPVASAETSSKLNALPPKTLEGKHQIPSKIQETHILDLQLYRAGNCRSELVFARINPHKTSFDGQIDLYLDLDLWHRSKIRLSFPGLWREPQKSFPSKVFWRQKHIIHTRYARNILCTDHHGILRRVPYDLF